MSLDVTAILNRIYEKLLSLSKEIDCAIACISGGATVDIYIFISVLVMVTVLKAVYVVMVVPRFDDV